MDADLAMTTRLRLAELRTLAARAAERHDLESQWIHQLLKDELRKLEERLGAVRLCDTCPPSVAAVCPRTRD